MKDFVVANQGKLQTGRIPFAADEDDVDEEDADKEFDLVAFTPAFPPAMDDPLRPDPVAPLDNKPPAPPAPAVLAGADARATGPTAPAPFRDILISISSYANAIAATHTVKMAR